MLAQFLNVLIQVLVHKSHDLLREEIAITVYNMASVDFDAFYSSFLPHLLSTCEGLDENQKAVLAANFKLEKVKAVASLYCALCVTCVPYLHGGDFVLCWSTVEVTNMTPYKTASESAQGRKGYNTKSPVTYHLEALYRLI